jgi:hypothetical protein
MELKDMRDFQGNTIEDADNVFGTRISTIKTKKNDLGQIVAMSLFLEGGDVISFKGDFPANARFVGGEEVLTGLVEHNFHALNHRVKASEDKNSSMLDFEILISTDHGDVSLLWHVFNNPDFDVDPSPRLVFHAAPKWTFETSPKPKSF